METIALIALITLGIIVTIGLIRVIFTPYTNFLNLIVEMFLIDFLIDLLAIIISGIGDILD